MGDLYTNYKSNIAYLNHFLNLSVQRIYLVCFKPYTMGLVSARVFIVRV